MKPLKLMIVDDHTMVREGLKMLIGLEENLEVVAEAENGIEALDKIMRFVPDIVLMDINLPKMNGLNVIERLNVHDISTKVIVLTLHNDIEYLFRSVEIGVNGYVLKDADFDTLMKAIWTVHKGDTYIQPSLASQLMKEINRPHRSRYQEDSQLTRRELEVLQLITQGCLNKEIAGHLDISEKTAKNHVANIFRKINVHDRTQAAVYAIKNSLVKIS